MKSISRVLLTRPLRRLVRRSIIIREKEVDIGRKTEYIKMFCTEVENSYEDNLKIWENSDEDVKTKIDIILDLLDGLSVDERCYLKFLIESNSLGVSLNGGLGEYTAKILENKQENIKQVISEDINTLENTGESMTISKFLADSNKVGSSGKQQGGDSGVGETQEEAKEEEVVQQTKFTVKLVEVPAAKKLVAIKEIKSILGLGLKDAKTLVESAPVDLKTDMSSEESEELKQKIEKLGCSVEII